MQGYLDEMIDADAPVAPPILGDWTADFGYYAGRELVRTCDFTAVFAANDQMALGLLHAFRDAGLRRARRRQRGRLRRRTGGGTLLAAADHRAAGLPRARPALRGAAAARWPTTQVAELGRPARAVAGGSRLHRSGPALTPSASRLGKHRRGLVDEAIARRFQCDRSHRWPERVKARSPVRKRHRSRHAWRPLSHGSSAECACGRVRPSWRWSNHQGVPRRQGALRRQPDGARRRDPRDLRRERRRQVDPDEGAVRGLPVRHLHRRRSSTRARSASSATSAPASTPAS